MQSVILILDKSKKIDTFVKSWNIHIVLDKKFIFIQHLG